MKDLVNKCISNAHILLVLYGLYGFWVKYDEYQIASQEITNQFPQIETEAAAAQKKLKEIQEFLKKTDEYKARVEGVAKNIEEVQKQLPHEINDSQIITYFNSEISVLNIKDPSIVPGKEETGTYFISKTYNLRAKGTFLQFLILLERIGNGTRIYNIKNLTLTTDESNKRGRFQIVNGEGEIQAYRFNPDFRVDRGFDKIEKIR